jgi:hypothetical protein
MKKTLSASSLTLFALATLFSFSSCTTYLVYSEKEAKFGKHNIIEGNVGVKSKKGKAEFDKHTVLDPYEVKAAKVEVKNPSTVNNITQEIADDGYEETFYPYDGNVAGINDITVQENQTVTLFGDNFKKITIKKGANVTFVGSIINIEELKSEDANIGAPTFINFEYVERVQVKNKVEIGKFNIVNKSEEFDDNVTFYCGDNMNDNEKFTIKGDSVYFRANIMIPKGKLSIKGGGPLYTEIVGWFEGEKVETGDMVIWKDPYNEAQSNRNSKSSKKQKQQKQELQTKELPVQIAKNISVFPNPSNSVFTFQLNNLNIENQSVQIRIFDVHGKNLETILVTQESNFIKAGASLIAGTYFAEIIYGEKKQIIKLIKE